MSVAEPAMANFLSWRGGSIMLVIVLVVLGIQIDFLG